MQTVMMRPNFSGSTDRSNRYHYWFMKKRWKVSKADPNPPPQNEAAKRVLEDGDTSVYSTQ